MCVGVFLWADVVHLKNVATFWAALDRAVARHLHSESKYVRLKWVWEKGWERDRDAQ